MPLIELSRFFPAEPDEVYDALLDVVMELARLQSAEDFSRAVSFATKTTGWASGANVSGYVVPGNNGSLVRLEGQAKVRSQLNANNAAHKQCVAILDAIGPMIESNREAARKAD